MAHEKRILLSPCLPTRWQSASLKSVRVGDQTIDLRIAVDKERGRIEVEVTGLAEDWTVDLEIDPEWYGFGPGDYTLRVTAPDGDILSADPGGSTAWTVNWKSRGRDLVVLEKGASR